MTLSNQDMMIAEILSGRDMSVARTLGRQATVVAMTFSPFAFHLSPRLCPSTAGCSPPSMSSVIFCVLFSSDPGGSLLPCYVVLPSSAWSSS